MSIKTSCYIPYTYLHHVIYQQSWKNKEVFPEIPQLFSSTSFDSLLIHKATLAAREIDFAKHSLGAITPQMKNGVLIVRMKERTNIG